MSRITRAMGTSRVPILLALVLGGATFVAALVWLPEMSSGEATPTIETAEVMVASRDVAAGVALDGDAVRMVRIPSTAIAAGSFTTSDQVIGRMLRYPVSAGEQILASKFVDGEQSVSSGLAFVIPEGMRAVSVPLSEISGAGGLIVPGDRVDVLAAVDSRRLTLTTTQAADALTDEAVGSVGKQTAVVTILQDTLVLAIGQTVGSPSAVSRDRGTQRVDDGEVQPEAVSVTLAVTPAQAQTLFMAVMEGSIGLALRPFGETQAVQLKPAVTFSAEIDVPQVAQR